MSGRDEFRRKKDTNVILWLLIGLAIVVLIFVLLDIASVQIMQQPTFYPAIISGLRLIEGFILLHKTKVFLCCEVLFLIILITCTKNFINKNAFRTKYQCIDGLKGVKVKWSPFSSEPQYQLGIPYWDYSNKDGCRDLRYKNSSVNFPTSVIGIDHYKVKTKDPILAWDIVHHLRGQGVEIPFHEFEECVIDFYKKRDNHLLAAPTIENLLQQYQNCPTDFEKYVCDIYRKQGYLAETTPPTNDGGYDFVLKNKEKSVVAIGECKLYSQDNVVGRPLLQKLVGANAVVGAKRLIFVTTSTFSKDAISYAKSVGIELIDGDTLNTLIKSVKFSKSPKGEKSDLNFEIDVRDFPIPWDILQEYYPEYVGGCYV